MNSFIAETICCNLSHSVVKAFTVTASTSIMRLGELVEMRTGYPFRKRIPFVEKGGCRLVQMGDVSATKGLIWDTGLARVEAPGDWQKHVLHCGDLLFVARGVRNETATFGGEADDVIAAPHLFVMRCDRRSVSAEYLGWYLNLPETRELIRKFRGGSAVPFVPMAALAGLEVPVPSMEAQNTIVCIDRLKLREQELLGEITARRRVLVDGLMMGAVRRETGWRVES